MTFRGSHLLVPFMVWQFVACGPTNVKKPDVDEKNRFKKIGETGLSENPLSILSLDGGGVRSVITASLLESLEEKTSTPIHKLFDMIVATSSGGVLALALTAKIDHAPMSARDVKTFIVDNALDLFNAETSINTNLSQTGFIDEAHEKTEKKLKALLGTTDFKDSSPPVFLTSVDVESAEGFVLSSTSDRFADLSNVDAAKATFGSPNYFHPLFADGDILTLTAKKIDFNDPFGSKKSHFVIGGGIYKNSPSLLALELAESTYDQQQLKSRGILLVSLGTGKPLQKEKIGSSLIGANVYAWTEILIEAISEGSSNEDDALLSLRLKGMPHSEVARMQPDLDNGRNTDVLKIKNVKKNNIDYLLTVANNYAASSAFSDVVEKLKILVKHRREDHDQ